MLPPDLMREAKARSAERGETLKALLTRAVEAELGRRAPPTAPRARVALPIFGRDEEPRVGPSNVDLERALAGADLQGATSHAPTTARRTKSRAK